MKMIERKNKDMKENSISNQGNSWPDGLLGLNKSFRLRITFTNILSVNLM